MKKLVVAIAILVAGVSNTAVAGNNSPLKKKLKEAVKFEKNELPMKQNEKAFVKVSFDFNEDGSINILDINSSDEEVKKELLRKLAKVKMNKLEQTDEVYYYNFIFKKV